MAEYIEREALKKELEENTPYNWSNEDYEQGEVNGYKYAVSIVEAQDAAEVVEVVRCKDCKWWTKQEDSAQGRCTLGGHYPTGRWYCANGARMDGEGE